MADDRNDLDRIVDPDLGPGRDAPEADLPTRDRIGIKASAENGADELVGSEPGDRLYTTNEDSVRNGGERPVAETTTTRRVWREYTDPEVAARISEVPPEPRPFSTDAPRAGFESGIIFILFALVYAANEGTVRNGDERPVTETTTTRRVWREYTDPEVAARISEVPPEPRPFSTDAPRAGFESGIIFILFALVYGIVGYFTLTEGRIVNFISLAHLNEAYMVFWNDPPRLAAIGMDAAPLASIAYMPFSLIKPVATSLIAMPVLTALAAGLLMASLNSLMRVCDINLVFRIILLILFGLNPMFVYYAGNGAPETLGLYLLGVALVSLISWSITGQTRHLAAAGLVMGLGAMVDYGFFLIAVGFAIAFMIISAASKDDGLKVRSTLLLFLTPVVYALLLWCLLNWVLLGNPFEWISAQNGVIEVNTTGALQEITTDFWGSLGDLFEVTLGIAPLAFVAAILAIIGGVIRRDGVGWGLFVVGLFIAAAPVLRAVGADQANLLDLAYGLPLAVFAVATVSWFGRDGWGTISAVIMAIGLIAALPLGWNAMQDYRYQNQAEAYTHWIDGWNSQEGTSSVGGYTVGINPELAMAEYINNEIPQKKRSVLVDQNFSYGVMITSGRPQQFFDRADEGEGTWQSTIDSPWATDGTRKVDYMLITTSRAGDQIAKKWPEAVQGGVAGLVPVFRTDRYVLVEVAETRPAENQDNEDDPTAPRTEPNPVTPSTPIDPTGPSLTTPSQAQGQGETTDEAPVDTTPTSPSFGGNNDATQSGNGNSSAPNVEGE